MSAHRIPAEAVSALRSALPWSASITLTDAQLKAAIRAVLAAMPAKNPSKPHGNSKA